MSNAADPSGAPATGPTHDPAEDAGTAAIAAHAGAPLVSRERGVVRVRLNRPSEHNRLDPADVDAISGLLDSLRGEFDADPQSVRAFVITGSGERSFSSGYTLHAILDELDHRLEGMLDALEALPVPTIAAINGGVYGGATDLALCCDLRIGVVGTRMFMPAARFGLHYYPGGLRRYVSRLGLAAASKLMLTAATIEADEMLRIGFLGELVAREQLAARVETCVEEILRTDPVVVAQMKRHLHALAGAHAETPEARALESSMLRAYEASLRSQVLRERLDTLLGG